jgi:hypothetical protein
MKIVARCTAKEQGTVTLIPDLPEGADPETAPCREIHLHDCSAELEALFELDKVVLVNVQPMHL